MVTSILFCLSLFACNAPTSSPDQGARFPASRPIAVDTFLAQSQIDSLRMLHGKAIPLTLWSRLFEEPIQEIPVFVLSGNLDQDAEEELVLWYYWEGMRAMGEICLLDSKPSGWKKIGTEYLDFYRGTTPPRIDTRNRVLLTYSYGSGSGYGSEVLNFYQNRDDSLLCVFKLLETEGLFMMGSGVFRNIHATYQFIDSSQILATYHYQVHAGDNSRRPGKMVFEAKLVIPFIWNPAQNRFAPKLPVGFPPLNSTEGYLDEGESSFDPFYEPELEKIKWHGPAWKREALGNPNEN